MAPTEHSPHASPDVRLERLSKRFGSVLAVDGVSLDVRPGEFFSLLGPSGCGKTTLLRMLAGFEHPDEGQVLIGGKDVTRTEPQRRPTAMVFQNYALFPTMTVGENVAYGLQARKMPKTEQAVRVAEVLAAVDLKGYESRPVTALSGGQQQRVALARALAVRPDVLLFDEPLSNLDVALREQTRRELKMIQERVGMTSVYVTHDQQEALSLSDRMAVMRSGRIVETGTPQALYQTPETAFVAEFLGSNIISDAGVAARLSGENGAEGAVLAVRPEHLRFNPTATVRGRVLGHYFLGTHTEWWVETEGTTLRVWADASTPPDETVGLEADRYRWVGQ